MLNSVFTIRTENEDIARGLGFLTHFAEQDYPVLNEHKFDFHFDEGQYKILRGDEICYSSRKLYQAIFNQLWLIHNETLNGISDCVRIHAGCGELEGRRFLVVGDKGAGKTTLMMRLLFGGFRVVGDELVLLQNGKVTPFPRRFHIKQSSLELLPGLEAIVDSLPFNWTDYGHKLYSFSPHDTGLQWKIDAAEVHSIFYLEPNHGGETVVEECPKFQMVCNIMPMSFFSESYDYEKIAKICHMVDQSRCYVLHLGNLEGAASALREKMDVL